MQGGKAGCNVGAAQQCVGGCREASSPVRMFVDRAGQVGLLGQRQGVFYWEYCELTGRVTDMGGSRIRDRATVL